MRPIAAIVLFAGVVCATTSKPASVHTLAQREPWWNPWDPPLVSASANGRYVAFTSYAQLAPADTNLRRDVYVLDRHDGLVTLESVTTAGEAGLVDSGQARISGDGRFLVYETMATPSRGPAWKDVLLRDRHEGSVIVVSVGRRGEPANGTSRDPAISGDGRVVALSSAGTNLVDGADANGAEHDVYVFEVDTGRLSRISVDDEGVQPASGASVTPALSGDGRYVAFASTARLERAGAPPDARTFSNIYVWDRERNQTRRLSLAPGGRAPDGPSWAPAMSADGQSVVFVSSATNLVPGDRNRSADVFLANLRDGLVELISRSAAGGAAANGRSGSPALSGDGRFIAFQSEASDLVCARRCRADSEDINLLSDVFLLDRRSGAITRVSGDAGGGWMAPSAGPSLDVAGELVVFSSRHPIDASDTTNDFDLFLCANLSRAAGTGVLRERPDGLDH